MAFVDLRRDVLVLKVILAGPPAVGKTERLAQLGLEGRSATFSMTALGPQRMAVLETRAGGPDPDDQRSVEVEFYEWHGPEKADVRAKGLFVGLDGLVYMVDAREDRYVDTVNFFDFLLKTAGKSKIQRLPGLMVLGQLDVGLLRCERFVAKLRGPAWSAPVELPIDDADGFVDAIRVYTEAMLARIL